MARLRGNSLVLTFLVIVLAGSLLTYVVLTPRASEAHPQLPPGILRGDIIIFRGPFRSAVPDDMNILKPANPNLAVSGSPIFEPLWYLNVTAMRLVPMLAAAPPEYSEDFKMMRIKVRPGVYWNDGVEFTAEDIAFTIMLFKNTTGLTYSAYIQRWVEKAYVEDKYTVVIELKEPNPKFHMTFTNVLGLSGLIIVPKHVWEGKDPLKFTFNPPVGTGPYVLDSYDPEGYWALFRRRDDWERSATGRVLGKPKPKYLLRVHYKPDDPKQVIAISRHELDITELTTELWETAKSANPYILSFWRTFPYAWQNGICDHGPCFNLAKYPYNITDVRWALTLAINITEVNIMALNAMGRIATFRSLSVPYLQVHYESLLLPWIKEFTLSDGYKPFDPTVPQKLAKYVESKGYELAADPVRIWGPGWWKYDPEEAAKLLKAHGFYKDEAGRWHLPSGELWTLDLVIPAFHPLASRLGFATAEQWRKFGIDVKDEALEGGMFWPRWQTGDFDVIVMWPFCSAHVDTWQWWQGFHKRYVVPLGKVATSNQIRWSNDRVSELLDELAMLTPEDPRVIEIVAEIVKESFKDMPVINYFLGSKLIVFDTYVWTNWPTGDNWYWEHSYWNPMWCLPILVKLKPTGNVPTTEIPTGPPTPAVEIKGINATLAAIAEDISGMKSDIADLKESTAKISEELSALAGQIGALSTMSTIIAVEAIIVIILVIVLIATVRKRS